MRLFVVVLYFFYEKQLLRKNHVCVMYDTTGLEIEET